MISRYSNRSGDPQSRESAPALKRRRPAAPRRHRSAALALLLGAAAVVVVVTAWRTQARNAGPVRRRTAERLRRGTS